jgi:CheY-like chemotaxis protein
MKALRILVVEDEALVAMLVEDMLTDMGHEVVRVAHRLETGLVAVERDGFDVAVLDVNLNDVKSFPIADALSSRGIPFVFATGYGMAGLDERFFSVPTITKPFDERRLADAINAAVP